MDTTDGISTPTTMSKTDLVANVIAFCREVNGECDDNLTYEDIVNPIRSKMFHHDDYSRKLISANMPPLDKTLLYRYITDQQNVPTHMLIALRLEGLREDLLVQIYHHEKYGADVPMTLDHLVEHRHHIRMFEYMGQMTPLW